MPDMSRRCGIGLLSVGRTAEPTARPVSARVSASQVATESVLSPPKSRGISQPDGRVTGPYLRRDSRTCTSALGLTHISARTHARSF